MKFRAWDKDKKRMVRDDDYLYADSSIPLITTIWTEDSTEFSLREWDNIIYMQYIGLKDKNGVDVYCSDILKDRTTYPLEVFWMGFVWGFKWKAYGEIEEDIICNDEGWLEEGKFKYLEVIGNIYENPELTKELK